MTRDDSPYFCRACEIAAFGPERMGERDVVSTESLSCRVNALEPGQRYEPRVRDQADKLHTVLGGRGAFVIGDSRRILGPGDVALAPAGVEHRAFANQGERLVLLVVTSPLPSPAAAQPADPEPAPASHVTTEIRRVPMMMQSAEVPLELPVTRRAAPSVRTPAATDSGLVRSSADFSRLLNSLRVRSESTAVETPPEIPETRRCSPRSSRVRAETVAPPRPVPVPTSGSVPLPPRPSEAAPPRSASTSSGSDWLPAIFRKSALDRSRDTWAHSKTYTQGPIAISFSGNAEVVFDARHTYGESPVGPSLAARLFEARIYTGVLGRAELAALTHRTARTIFGKSGT